MVKKYILLFVIFSSIQAFGQGTDVVPGLEKEDSTEIQPARMETTEKTDFPEFDRDKILLFADYLFNEGEYQRASVEYHRFNFGFPNDSRNQYSLFRIGLSNEKVKKYDKARKYYHNLIEKSTETKWVHSAYYRTASTYYEEQKWVETIFYIDSLEKAEGNLGGVFDYLRGWCYLHIKRYSDAQKIFERLNESDIEQRVSSLYYLISKTKQAQIMSGRSPFLSGLFSTVIPGAGQLYCGRIGDAGYSFVLSVGCAASSYYLWEDDKPFAITMAALGTFFYLGNIYGAVNSAKIYNDNSHREFIKKTEEGVPHKPTELFQKP
ncbi:tetratricopeptide repeat protein [bacterium]|nr:tetratricopeptide repeat protein [bacterium]